MTSPSWLTEYGPLAGAAGAIVAAILGGLSLRLATKQKSTLDIVIKLQEIAVGEIVTRQREEVKELGEAIGSIQSMRDSIQKLLFNAGINNALPSTSILEELDKGHEAIELAYRALLARHPKEENIEMHSVKESAVEICGLLRAEIGTYPHVPRFDSDIVDELKDARARMELCQDGLRQKSEAIKKKLDEVLPPIPKVEQR